MNQHLKYILIIASFLCNTSNFAQSVKYTEVERDDPKNLNFDIIGKFTDNIIVYKNFRSDNFLSVYDLDMKLKERIKLTSLPSKIINADFIAYPNYFYMIYQYQKKTTVYCEAIKFDNKGKKMEETYILDTTQIPFFQNDNKIYNVIVNDNKQKIAVIKANKKNEKNHLMGVSLFDNTLKQQYKRFININMDGKNNFLDEFTIDNDGDIFLAKCFSVNGNEYVTKFDILQIPLNKDTLLSYEIKTDDKVLDEIVLKTDNVNKRIIMQSFFYTKRRGNIDGLFISFFDKTQPKNNAPVLTKFNDTIRTDAKSVGGLKMAFNDFFIRQIYPRKDGGFIVNTESYYTTSRGNSNPWNRWDYFSATPYLTSYDYYNMGARDWYWNSWDRYNSNQNVTYFAENVIIFSFNKFGKLEWSNVINKNQKDDGIEDYISYQTFLSGGQINFLFNEKDRNDFLMYNNSVSPDGKVTRHPTLKNLNRQYQLMPRFGKQISAKEMIFPCAYKNYICFAKLEL